MAQGFIGASGCMAYLGALKMRKGYIGAARVYSAGNIVTYHVDTGITYQEKMDEGASCLSPRTFTPAKTGWEFVGWRQDTTATDSEETSIPMPDAPVTLYAVFKQDVTITCYDGSTAAVSVSRYRYYNNGNLLNPTFALTQTALSGWTARGWSTDSAANGGITYANGASFTRDSNITLYGMYQQTITLSYSGNGATGGSTAAQTGTRYYNPGSGTVLNPSFSLRANGFTRSGYTFSKWALGSTGGTQYAAGASITPAASTTVYAVWTAAEFTMALDPYGWSGPTTVQGNLPASIDTNSSVVSTYGGLRLMGGGDGTGATAWAAAKISKTINTRGLPRATITLMLGSENKGSVMIGSSGYDFFSNGNTSSATINLDTSVTSQLLTIQVANYGDAYHSCAIYVGSIRFHS